ncbi:hypothetical protein MKX01_004251 [Papaver californicum]|nr:hypothetical protein MKX01_004251 [Papaver californicum]
MSQRRSTTRKGDLVFVVNPTGANGRTGKEWKKLLPYLRTHLGQHRNICECLTSAPSHAIDITREAIREGADAVVAVGGDGTLHEVVNGFFWAGKPVSAHDDKNICRSAKAGYYASKYKQFGNLCYVIGALRGFMGHSNQDLRIKVNGGDWELIPQVTALCVGNAKFFGGGMKITPNADPCNGNLEVVILQNFKWYDFIFRMHKLYKGTHLSVQNVSSRSLSKSRKLLTVVVFICKLMGNILDFFQGSFTFYLLQ